jgi:hypothetical protein
MVDACQVDAAGAEVGVRIWVRQMGHDIRTGGR